MKRIDISTFLYILMILIIFVCGTTFSQEFVTTDNFKDKIAKDITVMEFWAGWNESNQFNELNKLNDCNAYRIDIIWTSKINIMLQLSQRLLCLIMALKNVDSNPI